MKIEVAMNEMKRKKRAGLLALGAALMLAPRLQAAPQFLEDEAETQFDLAFTATPSTSGALSIVYDYVDAKNFYTLEMTPGSVGVKATIKGATRLLGRVNTKLKPSSAVVLKRRRWVTEVVIDRRVVLETYDATFNTGKIGSLASGGWKWDDARVQPVEDIYFADDFTRLPGEKGEWKYNGGWTQTSSSEESAALGNRHTGVSDRIEMSANPFAFRAQSANGSAWAQAGRWFWDDYEAQVSVKPLSRGVVGMAVYAADEKNYLGFTWSANEGASARQLVRVVDGKSTILASAPGAFLPRQWYRLSMRTSPGFVEAFIDGVPVFKVANTMFGGGGIALLARNIKVADFDDARVTSYTSYRQEFAGAMGGAWTSVGGKWNAQNGLLTSSSSQGEAGKTRFFLTGRQDWDGYLMNARARSGAGGACGLVVGYQDDKNYSVFRWAGKNSNLKFANRQQLMRYANGKAKIVSDQPLTLATDKDGFAQVSVKLNSGAVAVYENDRLIAQMADETLSEGRPALWAQGTASAAFRDVVMSFPPPPVAPKVASKMANDTLMVGWASPTGEWPPVNAKNGIEYWNTGEFFGDATYEYSWRRASNGGGKLELALRAKRSDFNAGYVAQFEDLKGKDSLQVTLKRGSSTLKQADFSWKKLSSSSADDASAKPVRLRVELEGRGVLIYAGDNPLMSYMSDGKNDPSGTNFAARPSGFSMSARDLVATSEHRDDYTFSEAPTDWYAPQGEWSVISRWPCYADWSFFGGAGLNPTLWTKRTYAGDTVVEMYVHNQMDMPKEPGYSTPGNLNVSIGGDGKNPSSGYSFIIAGWGNTKTRIYKGAQKVAENTTDAARFVKPINHNPIYHNRWFYVRAETRRETQNGKAGIRLRVSVDDVPLCDYFDANPLPSIAKGGRVALWTLDSVFMVARAKIESSVMGTRSLPSGLLDADTSLADANAKNLSADTLVPRPIPADGLATALVSEAKLDSQSGPVWTVRNPASGGLFAVKLFKGGTSSALKVTPSTRLDMDITMPGETHVDLYASIDGVVHLISLGKAERPDARVVPLGSATVGTIASPPGSSGSWKHVSFNLGAALKNLYPDQKSWNVDSVQIGALHGDEYRWQGFEGNPMGAAYQLRGARLSTQ